MSLGRMIRADDLVEVIDGPHKGKRGVVLKRTLYRKFTYVRVQFKPGDQDGKPIRVTLVTKVTFERLAAELGLDPYELDWLRTQAGAYSVFYCPLCQRIAYFETSPEICRRCNWRKPNVLERLANAART